MRHKPILVSEGTFRPTVSSYGKYEIRKNNLQQRSTRKTNITAVVVHFCCQIDQFGLCRWQENSSGTTRLACKLDYTETSDSR
jgi:hypothetical protein